MGVCASQTAFKENNREVAATRTEKLLLLGTSESGKSTLLKQMISLYGEGFSDEDRRQYVHVIYGNAIESMLELLAQTKKLRDELEPQGESTVVSEAKATLQNVIAATTAQAFADIDQSEKEAVAKAIRILWGDEGVQTVYEHRSEFQLVDSAKYYFENMDRIVQPTYVPTMQDVQRARTRTTGFGETRMHANNTDFVLIDVGGLRSERKREYDQMLFEDEKANRLHEALHVFDEVSNSRWFRNATLVLFLNKRDLFEEKIKRIPLTVCFPEFPGPQLEYNPAVQYIQQRFEALHQDKSKAIYTHVMCALDTADADLARTYRAFLPAYRELSTCPLL